jgi:hypothetical protein
MKIIEVQMSEWTDHLTKDWQELTKLPYPFFADEHGMIGRQDFWNGRVLRIVGFQEDLAQEMIDLFWDDAYAEPEKAIGMYVVTENQHGDWVTHMTAVRSMNVLGEVERS